MLDLIWWVTSHILGHNVQRIGQRTIGFSQPSLSLSTYYICVYIIYIYSERDVSQCRSSNVWDAQSYSKLCEQRLMSTQPRSHNSLQSHSQARLPHRGMPQFSNPYPSHAQRSRHLFCDLCQWATEQRGQGTCSCSVGVAGDVGPPT